MNSSCSLLHVHLLFVVIILGVVKCVLAARSSAEMESRTIHKSSCDPHHVTPFEVFMKHVVLTLCTQSFMSVSPMHLSSALADSTRMKLCARCTLWMSLSSNLPASSFSTSMNTLYPRTWRCTFSRLCERQGKQPRRSQITWECYAFQGHKWMGAWGRFAPQNNYNSPRHWVDGGFLNVPVKYSQLLYYFTTFSLESLNIGLSCNMFFPTFNTFAF